MDAGLPFPWVSFYIKTIPTSHVKGAHCNTDSLHLMHEREFMSPHFLEEEKKPKEANNNFERGICEAEDGRYGCEQTVPSAVWKPGWKEAPASRQHK